MLIAIRSTCIGTLSIALAVPAAAQSIRSTIANARLGPGYAQLLNLAATPDMSAAHYELTGGDTRPTIESCVFPSSLAGARFRMTPTSIGGSPQAI